MTASKQREVCLLIGNNAAVLWSDASTSPSAMPDSRQRWQAIWERREELVEITHSHPHGPAHFSAEDESTMNALTSALGSAVRFSVVTPETYLVRDTEGERLVKDEPWWVGLLRLASGMEGSREV